MSGELKKQSKARNKRKSKEEIKRLWLLGSRNWTDKKAIRSLLSNFSFKDVDFVMLNVRPGFGQLALPIIKALKFDVVLIPVNTERDGINAAFFRNASRFRQLKPSHVYVFSDNTGVCERHKGVHTQREDCIAWSMQLDAGEKQAINLAKSRKLVYEVIKPQTKKAKK